MNRNGPEEFLTRAVVLPLDPAPAQGRLLRSDCAPSRRIPPVQFERPVQAVVTFTESTRHLAKNVAAGEASVQKDTILHVGGHWPSSVLIRYLIRYLEWYLIRYQVRPVIQ